MASETISTISMESPSSDSVTESDELRKLRRELRETRQAERLIRATLKNMKRILREMMDEYSKTLKGNVEQIFNDLEERLGKSQRAGDLAEKLDQLNSKIVNTIKARDATFVELAEVRKENLAAQKAIKEYHK
uniref:Uncharacterized protein n=1 Tax=Panagrolaimus sp. ES5 TaxID=591445 RepID=A0AC34FWB9_9BILA